MHERAPFNAANLCKQMRAVSKRSQVARPRLLRATPLGLASRLLDLGAAHRALLERFAQRGTITILFTDIANFTASTETGGERAAMKLLDIHDEIVAPAVTKHRGRVVKNVGDGIMAAFRDPANAVAAAESIIRRTRGDGRPALPLRIGLDTGRPTRRGEDYIGHTVNVAARLVKRCRAGEALVTDAVQRAAGDADGIVWRERGRPALKGVTKPPRTWRLTTKPERGSKLARSGSR